MYSIPTPMHAWHLPSLCMQMLSSTQQMLTPQNKRTQFPKDVVTSGIPAGRCRSSLPVPSLISHFVVFSHKAVGLGIFF
jgi:hypothetical protein